MDIQQAKVPKLGFMRLPQVLHLIPISKTVWWDGVAKGRYPKPIKLSSRTTAWRVEDIQKLIDYLGADNADS